MIYVARSGGCHSHLFRGTPAFVMKSIAFYDKDDTAIRMGSIVMFADLSQLLPGRERRNRELIPFAISKVLPYIVYSIPDIPSFTWLLFVFLLTMIDIALSNLFFAYHLIGVTWKPRYPHGRLRDIFTYKVKPEPFMPNLFDSNVFWILSLASVVIWIIPLIVNFFKLRFSVFLILMLMTFLEIANVLLYIKGVVTAKRQSDESFRSVLLSSNIERETFNEAQSLDES